MKSSLLGFDRCIFRRSGVVAAIFYILIYLPAHTLACPLELPTATMIIQDYTLTVELATTRAARSCGLSRRDELAPDHGMLFIFPDRRPRTFWMKDTKIPLSIAFLGESGQIQSLQTMTPLRTDKRYRSLQPARYALEVNQGWFERHGIEVGDMVEIKLPLVLDIR